MEKSNKKPSIIKNTFKKMFDLPTKKLKKTHFDDFLKNTEGINNIYRNTHKNCCNPDNIHSINICKSNVTSEEYIYYKCTGMQNKLFYKLKRGKIDIDHIIDLHGLTKKEAIIEINNFLCSNSLGKNICALIIHGKGSLYTNNPVLKNTLIDILSTNKRVAAYCSSIQSHGGTGATYVMLKK